MNFKFVISSANRSYQVEKDQKECPVLGKKLGESFSGDFLGLDGYELMITGGSDKDGFPMRKDIEGVVKKRLILTDGIGFHAEKGLRKRKMLRGNNITLDTVQINCKVTKKGSKPLEEVLGKKEAKPEEKPEEKPEKEEKEPKEEKPKKEDKKPEEKKEENKEEKPEPKPEKKEEGKEEKQGD